MLVNKRLI